MATLTRKLSIHSVLVLLIFSGEGFLVRPMDRIHPYKWKGVVDVVEGMMHCMISGIVQEGYGEFNPAASLIRIGAQVSHSQPEMMSRTIARCVIELARSHL